MPFCGDCNRARLSSDGQLYTCLFGIKGHDFRAMLRSGASDEAISDCLRSVWGNRVDRYSEPQPDLTLLRPRADFYASAHPTAADALLVIEVAQASANYDRSVKAGLYARANVGEYWLVDLNTAAVTRYLDPDRGGYRVESTLQPGQHWAPALLPHCLVTTRDIFG